MIAKLFPALRILIKRLIMIAKEVVDKISKNVEFDKFKAQIPEDSLKQKEKGVKRPIEVNLYGIADYTILATIILLCCVKILGFKPFVITGLVSFILLFAQTFFAKTKVNNDSDENIFAKSENDCDAQTLLPHSVKYNIDGVKVNGKVFKASDGTHIVVNADGSIKTKSFIGKFINSTRGGYLSTPPDDGWKPLFNAGEPKDKSTL